MLAIAVETRLAYGRPLPADAVARAALALSDMSGDAIFLSNGHWLDGDALGWTPLTDAPFDCGVIGHDARHAFIFRMKEED